MANVEINLDGVKRKLNEAAIKQGRYALANQAMADMNQFVPADEFTLRQTGHVGVAMDGSSVNWNTPYAARMFYMYMYNYTTPGTGPRWDLKAKSAFMSYWIKAFTEGADW